MSNRLDKGLFLFLLITGLFSSLSGQTVFVSPHGDDSNPGSREKPVASFAKAQALARKFPAKKSVHVVFAKGTYYLPQTVEFTADDSKGENASVTYMAEEEGEAVISGGSLLNLSWQPAGNGIFVAEIAKNLSIDQLYINGIRQRMARYPNAVAGKNVFDTWDLSHTEVADPVSDPLTPEKAARWKIPEGGYIHAMHAYLWGDMHWIIKGKNADGSLQYEGGWQNNRPSPMHPVFRIVENIFEELDAPGEWYYHAAERRLYYMPEPSADLKNAKVEVVRLKHLIEFTGSKENPVRFVNLQGFVFRHAARTFMENKEPLLRSDWTVYRGGAVVYNGAEDCRITACEFDQVGGNTIFVNNYNRRISIAGCYIHNSGANGIAFVGDPSAVRSPIFRYGNQDYQKLDRTPGSKGDNYPEDCVVEDCLITKTGRDEKQTAPVQISMSHGIRISHCSIYDVPRAGINISEGTFGGHIIENCDVFNTVLETGDHGSFNSWGRDRYWTPDVKATCTEVAKDPGLPQLDMLEPVIIRNNRWRCDHGWDIDLDDGSTWYRIYNNLLLNGGLKMREGYNRIATNNIIINNGLHPHVWFVNSGDVFKNNIVFTEYQPAIMDNAIAPDGKWGKEIDFNFYAASKEVMNRFAANGCDLHSLNGDPQFIDAANGDFRVKNGSPALSLGFVNFPMDRFGVVKPSLKAKAKTPEIPLIANTSPDKVQTTEHSSFWMDIELKEPAGSEMSAFGVSFDSGGVALAHVPDNSTASRIGFQGGDLIQEINGFTIKNIQDLKDYYGASGDKKNHVFALVRNQKKIKVTVSQPLPEILPEANPSGTTAGEVGKYNVVWDSPGENSFGSMPLGNGDIGLNVWVEKNGDLLFYISKVDAFDDGHRLPKLGRVRVRMDPALPLEKFRQTLNLIDASVLIDAGDVHLRLWIDANQPVIRVEGKSQTPRYTTISLESLRPLASAGEPLPPEGTVGVLFNDNQNRLAWCYRNQSSAWAGNFRNQNTTEMVAKTKDPILNRTSGCFLQAAGFLRENPLTLRTQEKSTGFDCSVKVISIQPETLQDWLTEASNPVQAGWNGHCAYWKSFWNRSYIDIISGGEGKFNLDQCRYTQFAQGSKAYEGYKEIDAVKNIFQISQRYALERFCEAAASRGSVPPPYNGSIFTMDMPAGVLGFDRTKDDPVSPDGRDWDILSFMWQNTRHPYWSMASRGDYDAILPGMQFVRDGLDVCIDHCKKIFGHEGAFIMEASWWHNVGVFNWDQVPPHLRYHQLASLELPAIMCEYYEHTRDARFLNDILLPCADEFLKYYELHFPKRDAKGLMLMEGVGCAETYQGVTNPCTEIGCMKYLLSKLLSFEISETRRQRWTLLMQAMPPVPLRKIRGLDLLAVGDKYDPGRVNCESPELYSIYPFRQVWLGQPSLLANARQSFHVRTISLDGTNDDQGTETGGWQSSPVQAAYLGLAREAARLASINFNDQFIHWNDNIDPNAPYPNRPRARFPAFWECKMDGTPDNDHGACSVNALQSMLLQSDGNKIFLLPAWPEDWDVSFKLCAAGNTTVECVYRDGKVQSVKVTPESRRADIINMSTPEQRIRTLVEVALADRNYLFGLPPMLDALPIPGKATGPWISKYGETLTGKAGPWMNSIFNGNTVHVHVLDWPKEGVRLPSIPGKLIASTSVTGNIQVKQDELGWLLTGTPDPLNTIVKLEFDSSVEDIALTLPSAGSLTVGKDRRISSEANGLLIAEVDLGSVKTIARFEFTIDNPGYLRGQGRPYELQVKLADGTWKTTHQGKVFGIICAKKFNPVAASAVRLVVQAKGIKQFDAF